MNIVEKAQVFATAAHAAVKQVRKYTGEPYIVHPIEVMNIVRTVPHTDEMLAAALLHDVVEDTGVTIEVIREVFDTRVAAYVEGLSDVSKSTDGNRAVRKAIDREHLRHAPDAVKTVKLADLISNTRSIVKHDLNFAETYLKEKMLLLEVLKGGNESLWQQAYQECINGIAIVENARVQKSLEKMEQS